MTAIFGSDPDFEGANLFGRCGSSDTCRTGGRDTPLFYFTENVVGRDPASAELIDHPQHVGYVYDIYGELLKLHISQIFIRPRDSQRNHWHPDGPRVVPYVVFARELPLQVQIGYWLTDLPHAKMGKFVYMPGSHRSQYFEHYRTHESIEGDRILGKICYVLLDERLIERYSSWPHFISTAPKIAYAYMGFLVRTIAQIRVALTHVAKS